MPGLPEPVRELADTARPQSLARSRPQLDGNAVKLLTLRRRRSSSPGIYVLYHCEREPPADTTIQVELPLLTTQESRHVEVRGEIAAVAQIANATAPDAADRGRQVEEGLSWR